MAQAIVTSQLMNLHFGRLKDQGRLSPVQARLPYKIASPCPSSSAMPCEQSPFHAAPCTKWVWVPHLLAQAWLVCSCSRNLV